jgi:hypothetical protein
MDKNIFDDLPDEEKLLEIAVDKMCKKYNIESKYDKMLKLIKNMENNDLIKGLNAEEIDIIID